MLNDVLPRIDLTPGSLYRILKAAQSRVTRVERRRPVMPPVRSWR
jgi:hypothetical protein